MKLCNVFAIFLANQIFRFFLFFSICFIPLSPSIAQKYKTLSPNTSNLNISHDLTKLPKSVRKMHAAIIKAAKTGQLQALLPVLERNEILPIVAFGPEKHPIDYWKSISKDGSGRDILAAMIKVFTKGYTVVSPGTAKERYVWPYLAELPVNKLSPQQKTDMLSLVSAEIYKKMRKTGKYLFYRASIGRDGTWHLFVLEE